MVATARYGSPLLKKEGRLNMQPSRCMRWFTAFICQNVFQRWIRYFRRRQIINISILLFTLLFVPFMYFQLTFTVRYVFKNNDIYSKCVIPQLNPYDSSIMKFVWDPEPLTCDSVPSLFYVDSSGLLQINMSSITYYGGIPSNLRCVYRLCRRHSDDNHVTFLPAVAFTPPIYLPSDFFSVTCRNLEGNVVYDQLLTNIAIKPNSSRTVFKSESENQLSVLLFGVDSVSRSCAIRKLLKTNKYLTETLKTYDFKGHMKVGENTLPNIVPLLTGRRVWTPEVPMRDYRNEPYDGFPFLWRNFSAEGYATLYAEDMADIGTFNYLSRGFINPPTDHYMRPYWLGLSEINKIQSKLSYVLRYLENSNINLQKGSAMCYGDKPHHVIQLDYLKKFIQSYTGKRKFALSFMTEIAHEYPNFLSYADKDFKDFLQWMHEKGHLNHTVLIFFSDHGARIDEIRNTFVGRIEERMPFVSVYIPEYMKKKFPNLDKNMQINAKRLTTNFDLYQTLVDILQGNFESPTRFNVDGKLRGISLFGPVPESRSCSDAWIPENFCACYSSIPVNVSINPIVQEAANEMVSSINLRLHSQPTCAHLSLHKIQEAHKISHGLEHTSTENKGISLFQFFKPEKEENQRYFVVIETVPGHAIFDALYDHSSRGGKLVGKVVRANKYRHQGDCISDRYLRPLCYCA